MTDMPGHEFSKQIGRLARMASRKEVRFVRVIYKDIFTDYPCPDFIFKRHAMLKKYGNRQVCMVNDMEGEDGKFLVIVLNDVYKQFPIRRKK